jgi:hypothetical protein
MHRRLVLSAILVTLIAGGITPVLGQSDLAAQLVGKWEGTQYQTVKGGSEDRTLIISSVTQREGKWIAEGRYGVKGGAKVQIEVDTTGQWPSLRWAMPNGNTVQVSLINPKTLSGKVTLVGTITGDRDRALTLEKKAE